MTRTEYMSIVEELNLELTYVELEYFIELANHYHGDIYHQYIRNNNVTPYDRMVWIFSHKPNESISTEEEYEIESIIEELLEVLEDNGLIKR